jgi:putative YjhG/YagF family dehydratase
MTIPLTQLLDSEQDDLFDIHSSAAGPVGSLPLTDEMLRDRPSGDIFGMTQNAGMGWTPEQLTRPQYLLLSTQGGIRAEDGQPIALGYHTGHWEVGLLMQAAAREFDRLESIPFAAFVSDPCDGRSQGTTAMMDSLAYRNDAAVVLNRLIRSLPTRRGVLGVATCDKGLPAMMIALASHKSLPTIIVPGGVTLPVDDGEDAGKVQSIGARYAHDDITLEYAADVGCRACASPGGGCQFLGTAGTSQVIAEALGLCLPHAALAPSGQPIWLDNAVRSARALVGLADARITVPDILTDHAIENALVLYAACGGSTNLLLHLPAIAFAAGLKRPTVEDWNRVNRQVPRLVDVLPNGPVGHPTVQFFLAGGVPELMLHLRRIGLLQTDALTVTGSTLGESLDWWEQSTRRRRLRELLQTRDNVDADDVILDPDTARSRGMTSTVTFPVGNLAPEGSVIKSTAIDPDVVDDDGVYRITGPARVFITERDAIAAIKGQTTQPVVAGDIVVLICRGPLGAGMEEIYQITAALRYLEFGKQVAVITDARFSGVSTGACIGHVGPEALAGGPIGKLVDGDTLCITVDTHNLEGRVDFVGEQIGDATESFEPDEGQRRLAIRPPRPDLAPDPELPPETKTWALLQQLSGGTWGGCVYDPDALAEALK